MGSRWRVNGQTYNVPEDQEDRFFEVLEKKGVTPTSIDDEEADAELAGPGTPSAPAVEAEMTVGPIEVIKSGPDMSFSEPMNVPRADEGPSWLQGIKSLASDFFSSKDTDPYTYRAMNDPSVAMPQPERPITEDLNGFLAGEVHGHAAGLERRVPGVREWSIAAEESAPESFAGGDIASNASPYSIPARLGKWTQAIPAATKVGAAVRALADVGTQGAISAADSAARQYGDTGEVTGPDTTAGGIAAALTVPGAIAGSAGARAAARAATPEAQATRATQYRNARLRSAGLDPTKALQGLTPDEQARLLMDVEGLAEQAGKGFWSAATPQQMNQRALDAAAAAGAEKDAALAALAAQGATVDQGVIADQLLAQRRPGDAPAINRHNELIEGVASGYAPQPYEVDALPIEAPPAPAMPPPLPPAPTGSRQPPPLPMQVAEQDLTPVRPAARFQPSPPEAMPAGPSVSAAGPQATTPPVAPPDPVGALAAQAEPELQGQVVAGGPRPPMSPEVFDAERELVGRRVSDKAVPTPEDDIKAERYAALMEAGRQGFGAVDPQAAQQWDLNNALQGRMLNIAEQGAQAANTPPAPFIRELGGLGAGAAIGGSLLAANPVLGALGAAGGFAAGRWAQPRRHAIQANWLSGDTNKMLERVSGLGQKPVGSMTASFGDLMRSPPPPEPDSNEQSSLSPGEFLGRDVTKTMIANPEAFRPWADDYSAAGTDDRRAAVTERLYRTDPEFVRTAFPLIRAESETV